MSKQQKAAKPSEKPSGPRGLAGYCWAEHPETGVHCTEPVGHEARYRDHWHPYTRTRWI